jgi:hypothetical protein
MTEWMLVWFLLGSEEMSLRAHVARYRLVAYSSSANWAGAEGAHRLDGQSSSAGGVDF